MRIGLRSKPAALSPFARPIREAVVREDTAVGDALCAEPADSPSQEADRADLLLVGQHLDVSQAGGVNGFAEAAGNGRHVNLTSTPEIGPG